MKLFGTISLSCAISVLSISTYVTAAEQAKTKEVSWGAIEWMPSRTTACLMVNKWPQDGALRIPLPFPNITRAYVSRGADGLAPLTVSYNKDASEVRVFLPQPLTRNGHAMVIVEIAESTHQEDSGRIKFMALDAKVHGSHAKLETHPGNHRIGFWTDPTESVTWNYTATRPGRYDVNLTYSCASEDGSQVSVDIGDQTVSGKLKRTSEGWYGYTWINLGKIAIEKEGPLTARVRCQKKVGDAVMNLKAITLVPTCEGNPTIQGDDGEVTLHARDVTIQGIKVRYEPKAEKNTVGFWTNPTDTFQWEFTIKRPGKYDVEVLQGCGKGQGGSEVAVIGCGTPYRLVFKIEETGHFQNFIPKNVGTMELNAGPQFLSFEPVKKAAAAIADVRQVRLVPHVPEKPAK